MRNFNINSIDNTSGLCVRGNDLLVATAPAYLTWHLVGKLSLSPTRPHSNASGQEIQPGKEQVTGHSDLGSSPLRDTGRSICERMMFHNLFFRFC